jgi:hypothetical protein
MKQKQHRPIELTLVGFCLLALSCSSTQTTTEPPGQTGRQSSLVGTWVPVHGVSQADIDRYREAMNAKPDVYAAPLPPSGCVLNEGGDGYLFHYVLEANIVPRSGLPILWRIEGSTSLVISMIDEEGNVGAPTTVRYELADNENSLLFAKKPFEMMAREYRRLDPQ